MKKTLITLLALCGVAAADTATTPDELTWTSLTITTPANGVLGSGNSVIDWSEATGNLTNSWELSFTLDPSRVSSQYLFGTVKGGSGAEGYTLQITGDGTIRLNANKDKNVLLNVGSYTAEDSAVAITLQYVKFVDTEGVFKSGTFTLTVGDATGTYTVDAIDNTIFTKGSNNNVWTNGGAEQLSGISLKYAGAVVLPAVPEPTTATLSLLALAGLAARRRRRASLRYAQTGRK